MKGFVKAACKIAGCTRPHRARGLCSTHYAYSRRYNRLDEFPGSRARGACKADGCERYGNAGGGWCDMHRKRMQKHGDHTVIRVGTNHPNYIGDRANYYTAHKRINFALGPARNHPCVDCGKTARDWSYNYRDPDERPSERGGPYSLHAEFYEPRCTSCHRKHDFAMAAQR